MAQHNEFGQISEDRAAAYLMARGYTIRERNWRFQRKEVERKIFLIREIFLNSDLVDRELLRLKYFTDIPHEKLLLLASGELLVLHDVDISLEVRDEWGLVRHRVTTHRPHRPEAAALPTSRGS